MTAVTACMTALRQLTSLRPTWISQQGFHKQYLKSCNILIPKFRKVNVFLYLKVEASIISKKDNNILRYENRKMLNCLK